MRRTNPRVFGYSYPAGAENDPNAPYNQIEEPEECPVCGEPNVDKEGNPTYPHDPSFCSNECYISYCIRLEEDDLRYEEENDDRYDDEW